MCPACGSATDPDALFCGRCGQRLAAQPEAQPPASEVQPQLPFGGPLPAQAPPPPAPAPEVMAAPAPSQQPQPLPPEEPPQAAGTAMCPTCAAPNAFDAPFCSNCGTELAASPESGPVGELVGPNGLHVAVAGVVSVGRDAHNNVPIPDPAISRVHCRLETRGTTVLLSDLNSTNGTWVNGRRVQHEELADGDRILVGRTELVFRSAVAAPPPQEAPTSMFEPPPPVQEPPPARQDQGPGGFQPPPPPWQH